MKFLSSTNDSGAFSCYFQRFRYARTFKAYLAHSPKQMAGTSAEAEILAHAATSRKVPCSFRGTPERYQFLQFASEVPWSIPDPRDIRGPSKQIG